MTDVPNMPQQFSEGRLRRLRGAWAEAHLRGPLRLWDRPLAAAAAASLEQLSARGRGAAAGDARPALQPPLGPSHALAAALTFPPGGGLVLDSKIVLAVDFFDVGGPVRSALPDFLGSPALTGRMRLPMSQYQELFLPLPKTWDQLSIHVAKLIEQVAWDLLEAEVPESLHGGAGTRDAASALQSIAAKAMVPRETLGLPKGMTRRQRKRAVAMRRSSAASASASAALDAQDPDPLYVHCSGLSEDVQRSAHALALDASDDAALAETEGSQNAASLGQPEKILECKDETHGEAISSDGLPKVLYEDKWGCSASWARTDVEHSETENPQEACSSGDIPAGANPGSSLLDVNAISWSSRGSVADAVALNLCEWNTASWSSRGSGAPWAAADRAFAWSTALELGAPREPDQQESGAAGSSLALRETNAASWNSRASSVDAAALNLCEVNTASWSSTGSRAAWLAAVGGPQQSVRSVRDVMEDLSLFSKGSHCQTREVPSALETITESSGGMSPAAVPAGGPALVPGAVHMQEGPSSTGEVKERHVLVAVPVSRLEAVARLLRDHP